MRSHNDYKVAILCAMSFEMSAVRFMLDRQHERLPSTLGDPNQYVLGELSGHNVVIACLPGQQGKGAAATVATNLSRTFMDIKWRFLVGIGGGVPSDKHDIRLGDVVVSMPEGTHGGVVQYDLGKITHEGHVQKGFLWPPPTELRNGAEQMRSDHLVQENKISEYINKMVETWPSLSFYRRPSKPDDLYHLRDDRGHWQVKKRASRTSHNPAIHYGLIASGDSVIKDAAKRDEIIKSLGDVICFEMEAAGWMTESPCMVVRGISDYGDAHKNDDWHHYAAATAAAFTKELLTYLDAQVPTTVQERLGCDPPSFPSMRRQANSVFMYGNGIQNTGSGSVSIGGDFNSR